MEYLAVLAAAVGCFAVGAVWYITLGTVWARAAGFEFDENGRPKGTGSAAPFAVGFLAAILLSGMMRHVFAMSGIDGLDKGLIAGLGVGLFMIAPWTWMNYAYAARPRNLVLIDCGYAILGPAVAGAILGLF
jgi:hypothetical protein